MELGTHVEVAMAVGGYHDSEQKLAEELWDHLPADALLVEDRGFFSYAHWKKLDARGTKLLARLKGNLILRPIQRLPDGSFLAKIYPSPRDRDRDRDGIVVRVIEYTLNDPERTGHGETHRLATNLFDHTRFPAFELACYYHERWEETGLVEQKTHQDPQLPSKPTHLRQPDTCGCGAGVIRLVAWSLRSASMMLEAAQQESLDVDRLSFTGCLQILKSGYRECDSIDPQGLNRWYRLLLAEMAQEQPGATPQPSQPPRGQTQDVQVRQETSGTSTPNALEENLCRDCGYYLTNGIGLKTVKRI